MQSAQAVAAHYWSKAWVVAVAMMVVIAVRVLELIPQLMPLRPAILTVGAAVALSAAYTPGAARRSLMADRQFRLTLAYVGVAIALFPFALWKHETFGVLQSMVLFDVPLVASILLCAPRARTLDKLMLAYVACTTVYAILNLRTGRTVEGTRLTTAGSYDSNDLAAILCTALPMACALIVRRGTWKRLFGLGCTVVLALAIMKTASRGGTIAMVVGTLVLLGGLEVRRFLPALLALTIAAPVVWSVAPETFRTRAETIFSLDEDYNTQSTSGRKYIWKRGLVFFAESPIIGVGPGNFDSRLGLDFAAQRTSGAWHTAHNTYIQLLVEVGAVGTAVFVAMLAVYVRAARRVYRRRVRPGLPTLHYPELLASIASFCASAMFLSHAFVPFTFFLLGLGGYAARVFENELGPTSAKPIRL